LQGPIGKVFKKEAKFVMEALSKIDSKDIVEKEKEIEISGKVITPCLLHLGKKLLILEIFKVYNVLFLLPSY
jgi:hypothetical protein